PNEENANKNNKPKFKSEITILKSKGIKVQHNILMTKVNIGDNINKKKLELLGINVSLLNNLRASAIACNNPYIPTTFGPLLRCMLANTFLSNTVKKATDSKIGNTIGKFFKKSIPTKVNILYTRKILIIKIILKYLKFVFLKYRDRK